MQPTVGAENLLDKPAERPYMAALYLSTEHYWGIIAVNPTTNNNKIAINICWLYYMY